MQSAHVSETRDHARTLEENIGNIWEAVLWYHMCLLVSIRGSLVIGVTFSS